MNMESKPAGPELRAVSCSGASNTGEYADKVTRVLDSAGLVNMNCLTKIVINDTVLIDKYKAAPQKAVAVDGCPVHCAKKILEAAGVQDFHHYTITDMGVKKGKTPVSALVVDKIAANITQQLVPVEDNK